MAVEPVGGGAAGEATSALAAQERPAYRRRDAAGAPPDAERLAVRTGHRGDDAGIAAQPPGGLRRDGGAVLDFAASRPAVSEHLRLNMNDDLVPVRCKRQRIAQSEQPLGQPRQRISAAHGARRSADERPTWDVGQEHLGVFLSVRSDGFPGTSVGGRIGGRCPCARIPNPFGKTRPAAGHRVALRVSPKGCCEPVWREWRRP